MSHEIVAVENPPEQTNQEARQSHEQARNQSKNADARRRRKGRIPTREDCLGMLSQLPGLITLKIVSPAEANAISKALQTILAETRASQPVVASPLSNENMLNLFRAQPELQSLLEPLLTNEQIDTLMKDVTDDVESET